jgi:REP element-mobilizing transposase RayT
MTNKYNPNIHHRRSIRLKGYDYLRAGVYFVTICVQHHECLFGKIADGEMVLNELGKIAHDEWLRTSKLRQNVELDEFVIMPNHVHGIICIMEYHGISNVGALSSIIRSYKSAVSKNIHLLGEIFSWQPRFHDHIIRNERSYQNISNYIANNPLKWADDRFYAD